ncbi:MAG: right-handed parallel beta-helix repeat-containing protein, partial [Candidatus Erginobacter occultus]|nr:right-handed parallel beta-helix repeat-containing protein [Candidatus Erginobacter occultus]
RWILANENLAPGDIVYVESGDYPLATPLEFSSGDEGDEDDPISIIGVDGEVLLNGGGMENCLVISGDYLRIENFSFTNANGSGVLITGNHDTVQDGRSFSNGGDGIEVTGDYATIRNMLVYGNGEAGVHLFTSHHSILKNNTCSGNGTREVFLEDEPVNALHPERPVGSTYARLRNNILDAAGPGRFAIFLDEFSQTEFSSDYNLFYTSGGAAAGYWNSATQTTFSDWTGSSGQDFNSIAGDPLYVGGGNYRLQSTRGSYKGGVWSADTNNSPGLDRGDPADISFYESAPHGDRVNLGAYGNSIEASWAIGSTFGTNYYVNDSSPDWDYYCTTGGLPWPVHNGLSPDSPLDSIQAVIDAYSLWPGDTVYVDTGLYLLDGPLSFPRSGEDANPITVAGSPRGTFLDGRGTIARGFDLTSNRHITLANVTLINAREYGIYADSAYFLKLAQTGARGANIDGYFIYRSASIRLDGCASSYHGRHGFYMPLLSNQTANLSGCRAENNAGNGIYLFRCLNSTVADCSSRNNFGKGFALENLYGTTTITDNQAIGNLNRGFSVEAASSSITTLLDGNFAQGNGEEGIYIASPNDSRITGNRATGNTKQGFRIYASLNTQILDNVSYLNQNFGFQIERSGGSFLLNNTSYKNGGEIKLVADISNTDLTIRDNTLWASGAGNYALRFGVGDPATLDWKSNYNCIYVTAGAYTGWLSGPGAAGRDFPTLSDWHIISALDGDSIAYDPVFVDPGNGDFHPQSPLGSYHNGYWTTDPNASPALNQGQIYLATSALTADIFPASPYIDLDDGTDFTATTGRVEINGNIISYTGKTGNRLTGVGGISTTHLSGSPVFQPVGSDYTREPGPNGERIDIGSAGGTQKASLALIKTLPILRPL